jgi:hypothetical protein
MSNLTSTRRETKGSSTVYTVYCVLASNDEAVGLLSLVPCCNNYDYDHHTCVGLIIVIARVRGCLDTCCCQTLVAVRQLLLSDNCCCRTIVAVGQLLLSDSGRCLSLVVVRHQMLSCREALSV